MQNKTTEDFRSEFPKVMLFQTLEITFLKTFCPFCPYTHQLQASSCPSKTASNIASAPSPADKPMHTLVLSRLFLSLPNSLFCIYEMHLIYAGEKLPCCSSILQMLQGRIAARVGLCPFSNRSPFSSFSMCTGKSAQSL